jgi:transposase-like protein
MLQSRPLECPACGHERIARRPMRRRTETVSRSTGVVDWNCQLCGYWWSYPMARRADLVAEME